MHRDLKPQNIVFKFDKNSCRRTGYYVVVDLGIAKDLSQPSSLDSIGKGIGTPRYSAPECFRDASSVTHSADVYSLGAILYHLLSGVVPYFDFRNSLIPDPNDLVQLRELRPDIHDHLLKLIERSMQMDPVLRPQNATEFLDELRQVQRDGAPIDRAKAPRREAIATVFQLVRAIKALQTSADNLSLQNSIQVQAAEISSAIEQIKLVEESVRGAESLTNTPQDARKYLMDVTEAVSKSKSKLNRVDHSNTSEVQNCVDTVVANLRTVTPAALRFAHSYENAQAT